MEYKSEKGNTLWVPIKGVFLKLLNIPESFIAISATYHYYLIVQSYTVEGKYKQSDALCARLLQSSSGALSTS